MKGEPSERGLRLAELVAALSLTSDLGLGQPMEHVMRSCLIALRLGERLGLDEDERAAVYYVALLAWVGCTADSHELSKWFGDDIAFRADTYEVDLAGLPALVFMLRHAGAGRSNLQRATRSAALMVTGAGAVEASMMAHCQATGIVAERLGLGPEVRSPLQHNFARWDGKGLPAGLGGNDIALSMRLVHLAEIVEVFHRRGGVDSAVEVARKRSGKQFDPAIVEEFCRAAPDLFGGLDPDTNWDQVIEAEPALRPTLAAESAMRTNPPTWSKMAFSRAGDVVTYSSRRRRSMQPDVVGTVALEVGSPIAPGELTPLEDFLTGRWSFYGRLAGCLNRGQIEHTSWELERAHLLHCDGGLLTAYAGYRDPTATRSCTTRGR